MSLLKKIFGTRDPLAALVDAFDRGAWAEVVQRAANLDDAVLATDPSVVGKVDQARNELVALNLREARTRFVQGDRVAGREHLDLARDYGASDEQLSEVVADFAPADGDAGQAPSPGGSGCRDCASGAPAAETDPVDAVSTDDLDLMLAGLPDDLAERYRTKPDSFIEGLQAACRGEDERAADIFLTLLAGAEDPDIRFEYAAALARLGRGEEACTQLNRVLDAEPGHRQALQTLVDLVVDGQTDPRLATRLAELAENQRTAGFAAACLVRLAWMSGDADNILTHGEAALKAGEADSELIQILALVHEKTGNTDRAEELLGLLSGGGCGGGAHPLLAEFWLRHGRHADRALEAFKAAARQDPKNPRWVLRIGQAYLARGWKRDGLKLLDQLSAHADLPADLREELERSLNEA